MYIAGHGGVNSLLFLCIVATKNAYKKASFNSITMATVVILSHKVQNPFTVNDLHKTTAVITLYYHTRPKIP
jgi:hypothetical protein